MLASVRGLVKTDLLSASDPVVRVWVGEKLTAQTEWTKNAVDYDFKQDMKLSVIPGSSQEIKFVVYDIDKEDAQPAEKDIVGSGTLTATQLLSEVKLLVPLTAGGKPRGTLFLTPTEAAVATEAVRSGKGVLTKKTIFIEARYPLLSSLFLFSTFVCCLSCLSHACVYLLGARAESSNQWISLASLIRSSSYRRSVVVSGSRLAEPKSFSTKHSSIFYPFHSLPHSRSSSSHHSAAIILTGVTTIRSSRLVSRLSTLIRLPRTRYPLTDSGSFFRRLRLLTSCLLLIGSC